MKAISAVETALVLAAQPRSSTSTHMRRGRSISRVMAASTPSCDDASMTALTLDEIAAKIAAAESGFAAATSQYNRNVFAQMRDEYKRYAAERAKQLEQAAAASSSS